MEQINRFIRDVEAEINSDKFIRLYQSIRGRNCKIKLFSTPEEVISRLHNRNNPDYALNDDILSALILEYRFQPQANPISSYLIILFKPGLLRLFSQFKKRAEQFPSLSKTDLWFQIITLFLEQLKIIDLNREKTKIASKLLGRLRNKLRDYFTGLFKELCSIKELDKDSFSADTITNDTPADIILLFDKLVANGIISGADKYILLASYIYKKPMQKIAKDLQDISYQAVRQRKIRAKKAIIAYFKKSKDSLSQFSF